MKIFDYAERRRQKYNHCQQECTSFSDCLAAVPILKRRVLSQHQVIILPSHQATFGEKKTLLLLKYMMDEVFTLSPMFFSLGPDCSCGVQHLQLPMGKHGTKMRQTQLTSLTPSHMHKNNSKHYEQYKYVNTHKTVRSDHHTSSTQTHLTNRVGHDECPVQLYIT